MANVIVDRVAFFLKEHAPFNLLNMVQLDELAHEITVRFFGENDLVFEQGSVAGGELYVLRQGSVLLSQTKNGREVLLDHCEPGEVFGVRSLLSNKAYVMSARCKEECLIYAIPAHLFHKMMDANAAFSGYFSSGLAAGQIILRGDRLSSSYTESQKVDLSKVDSSQSVITCTADTSIQEAAKKMKEKGVGSILVVDLKKIPLGIVTDTDLRNRVVAEGRSLSALISDIMSHPVATLPQDASHGEYLAAMLQRGIHHMVITADGTPNSEVKGLVSDHDLLHTDKQNPVHLIKKIKQAEIPIDWSYFRQEADILLRQFLIKGYSAQWVGYIATSLNDAVINRCIEYALREFPEVSKIDFCWVSLGSEGRGEQIIRTDQDNAIVFRSSVDTETERESLLKMAKRVNELLVIAGFDRCPAGIMAGEVGCCLTEVEWMGKFQKWIETPDPEALMKSTIFMDFRAVWGNTQLTHQLEQFLKEHIRADAMFLNHLAKNATQNPPPLSFFNNFVVERTGEHKNEFDIKKRAIMPLVDAARVLSFQKGAFHIKNTIQRFHFLAANDESNADLYSDAAVAFESLMKHRGMAGFNEKNSGRFLNIGDFTRMEKQQLKNAFLPISELQEMMHTRFQLAYFS